MVVVTYIPVQATPNWLQGSWLLPAFILLTSIDLNSRKERISPGWNIFNLTISPLLENNLLKNLSLFCGFYGVFFFCWILSKDLSTDGESQFNKSARSWNSFGRRSKFGCVRSRSSICFQISSDAFDTVRIVSRCTLIRDVKFACNNRQKLTANIR